jgi:hypothetical protein
MLTAPESARASAAGRDAAERDETRNVQFALLGGIVFAYFVSTVMVYALATAMF